MGRGLCCLKWERRQGLIQAMGWRRASGMEGREEQGERGTNSRLGKMPEEEAFTKYGQIDGSR